MIVVIDRAKNKRITIIILLGYRPCPSGYGNPEEAYKAMEEALQFCRQQIERKRGMGQPVVSNEMKLYLYYQNLSEWLCEDGKLEEALETVRGDAGVSERLRPLKVELIHCRYRRAFFQRGVVDGGKPHVLLGQVGKAGMVREDAGKRW